MIELTIIERDDIPSEWLHQFKAYASIADDSQDSWLTSILTKAVLRIQEVANRSLIACTIELVETDVEDNTVHLYQTVSEVLSVNGSESGWSMRGKAIRWYDDVAVVRYKTIPHASDIDNLLPIVYQYATALYDGNEDSVLANILKQC